MHSGFTVGATWQPSFVDTAHTPAKASEGKQLAHSCYAVVSDAQNCVAATGIELGLESMNDYRYNCR